MPFAAIPFSTLFWTVVSSAAVGFVLGAIVSHKAHVFYKKHAA